MTKQITNIVVLFISFLFYCSTLAPTIIGGDSSQLALDAVKLNLHFGNADNHPLYVIIGKLFSFLPFELAYSLNIMSAFFGAFTVMLVYLIIKKITSSHFSSAFGALSLMVSHAFWQHAVIAEVYTLNGFFLTLLIYLAVIRSENRYIGYFIPFVFIIGLLNHLILVMILPAFFYYILASSRHDIRKRIYFFVASFVFLLLLTVLYFYISEPYYLKKILRRILLGPPPIIHYLFFPGDISVFLKECIFYVLYLIYQYPVFGLLIGLIGIIGLIKRDKKTGVFLLLIILVNGFFFVKTTSWQSLGGTKYTFYISDYIIFSIFMGYGSIYLFNWADNIIHKTQLESYIYYIKYIVNISIILVSVFITVFFYQTMPYFVSKMNIDLISARHLKYRDNNNFFLNPNKWGYNGDRQLGNEILMSARKDSVIFADYTIYTVLKYLKNIDNVRPDIRLVLVDNKELVKEFDKIKNVNSEQSIYLADMNNYYNLKGIEGNYIIKTIGPLYEVVRMN